MAFHPIYVLRLHWMPWVAPEAHAALEVKTYISLPFARNGNSTPRPRSC